LIALALGLINSGTTGFADQTTGPSGSDSAAGQAAAAAHFSGASVNPTQILFRFSQPIWSHSATLDSVQRQLVATPAFVSVAGPLDPDGIPLTSAQLAQLHAMLGPPQLLPRREPPSVPVPPTIYNAYRATAQYISDDGLTVQWTTVLKYNHTTSTHDLNQIPALRNTVAAIGRSAGANATGVFGQMAFAYDVSKIATDDLVRIIPFVALVIFVLLAIVLRSQVAPIYLILSVGLSYLSALGFTSIVFVHLGPDSGLNFVLPFLMFVFLTALGSDYNILIMTRIREEARKRPLKEAVTYAVGVSGATITTAGVILAGTFAVLGIAAGNQSGADQIRQIGFGIAAGVIIDTFLIRTLLVPSVVAILGRWNWWPSKLYRESIDDSAMPGGAATSGRSAAATPVVRRNAMYRGRRG
jgi:RND superfamily putative drug exporter